VLFALAKHKVGSSTLLTRSTLKPVRNQGLFHFAGAGNSLPGLGRTSSFQFVLTFGDRSLDHGHIVISISRNGFLGFLSLSPSCAERKRWSVTAVIYFLNK
jgi:hypothetical protein